MSANARPIIKPVVAAFARHYGWTALALLPGVALAGPLGEQVQQGTVAVTRPDANTTTVTQGSNGAVVNWHSFSVDGHEYVQFVQPGANAAILNRVTGGNASQILGRIDANGRVFLVNPQGVYFSGSSRVDTAGFAASTLDINDEDFMQGRYVFTKGTGAPDAAVTNSGQITGDQFVVLMGDRVANEGLVQARLGTVALAAGQKVSLELNGSGLVSFAVDEATVAAQAGVENTGEIVANGGRVLMTAKVANDLVATAVNNAGAVRAIGVEEQGGEIYLRGAGGHVVNSGTLDASGTEGGRIVVQSATDDVEIKAGAVVKATGEGNGSGGTVRLVGKQSLDVEAGALVDARGGHAGGKGGLVEVSAHEGVLKVDGDVEVGAGGELIVDPARLGIDAGGGAPGGNSTLSTVGKGFIETKLNGDTNVTLVAGDEIFATGGPFTITATGGVGNLSIRIGQVTTGGSLAYGGDCGSLGICDAIGVGGSFGFGPDTTGDINLGGININIRGIFQASAGSATGNVTLGNVQASRVLVNTLNTGLVTGNVSLGAVNAKDQVTVKAGDTTGNLNIGAITQNSTALDVDLILEALGGNLNVAGPIGLSAVFNNGSADATLNGRTVNINGNVSVNAGVGGSGTFDVSARDGININGNVTVVAQGDSASIDLFNQTSGNINVNGNLTAAGNASFGSIDISNSGGNININGNLFATGTSGASIDLRADGRIFLNGGATAVAQVSYGSADISLEAQRGITVTGALVANGPGGADVFVSNVGYGSGSGDVDLQGAVVASADSGAARVFIDNSEGAITLDGFVGAQGAAGSRGSTLVRVRALTSLVTGANGIIAGPTVQLGVFGNGPLDVRTLSPDIEILSAYGGGSPDLSLDNSAFTGFTTLSTSTSISSGSYGSSFANNSFAVSGGFGATKLRFGGDVAVIGPFAARNALIEVSNGSLIFSDSVLIGDRNLPNREGDLVSLLALSRAIRPDGSGIPLPRFAGVPTSGPNAVFRARDAIVFAGGLTFSDPDTPYVVFQTDGLLDLGPGVFSESSIGNEFLAQFTAFTPTKTIHVEDLAPLLPFDDGPTFTNEEHFSKLPGTTMLIGGLGLPTGPQRGAIVIGRNGNINIGGQNILFSGRGAINGAQNVLSTGFIGEVGSLQDVLAQIFPTPIVNEFDELAADDEEKDKDEDYVDVEGDDSEGDDKLIAQKSNNGQMCQ